MKSNNHKKIVSIIITIIMVVSMSMSVFAEEAELRTVGKTEIPSTEETMSGTEEAEMPSTEEAEMPSTEEAEMPSTEEAEMPGTEEPGMPSTEETEISSTEIELQSIGVQARADWGFYYSTGAKAASTMTGVSMLMYYQYDITDTFSYQ